MHPATVLHSVSTAVRTREIDEDHLASVYRYATTNGGIAAVEDVAADLSLEIDDVTGVVDQLVAVRLLREDSGEDRRLVAVDPELAATLLVSPMESEIYRRRELIAQVWARTERLREHYAQAGRPASTLTPIERVSGTMEVRGYLKVAGEACRCTALVLQSGKQDLAEFRDLLQLCSQLLARGVAVRIVCQHRSRADLTTRMKIKNVTTEGASVRTVSHIPRAAVVFDGSVAVLLGGTDDEPTAARVDNDDVVGFLMDMFNHLWDAATPVDSFESGYAEVAADLQQTIAGLMARGYTDEVLARKLGMSVRTCRRHIAALMRDLGAVSRFQAGVQASQRSLVLDAG